MATSSLLLGSRVGLILLAGLLVLGAAACDYGDDPDGNGARLSNVSQLALVEARMPRLRISKYRTSGTYPQVSSDRVGLKAVNATIRGVMLSDEREYARSVLRRYGSSSELFGPGYPYPGTYKTALKPSLISASSVVVSALVPLRATAPGGTGGATYFSVTTQVPSGSLVTIRDLFAEPRRGLVALATEVRKTLLARSSCIRASAVFDPIVGGLNDRGFAPTARNYKHFVLTTKGLVIGVSGGQVSSAVCGPQEVRVSHELLGPYLSPLAKRLISGVRPARI